MAEIINGICEKTLPVFLSLNGLENQDQLVYPNSDISDDLILKYEGSTKCLKFDVQGTDDFIVRLQGSGDSAYFNIPGNNTFFIAPIYQHSLAAAPHTDFYISYDFDANTPQPNDYIDATLMLKVDFLAPGENEYVDRSYTIDIDMLTKADGGSIFEPFSTYTIGYRKDILGKFRS